MFRNSNQWIAAKVAWGHHRGPSGRLVVPVYFQPPRERRRFVRIALRVEAVLATDGDLVALRRSFTRASGCVECDQCGLPFCDHPDDVAGEFAGAESLTILCDRTRVKL